MSRLGEQIQRLRSWLQTPETEPSPFWDVLVESEQRRENRSPERFATFRVCDPEVLRKAFGSKSTEEDEPPRLVVFEASDEILGAIRGGATVWIDGIAYEVSRDGLELERRETPWQS